MQVPSVWGFLFLCVGGVIVGLLCNRYSLGTRSFSGKKSELHELRQLSTSIEFDQANSQLRKARNEKAWPHSLTPNPYGMIPTDAHWPAFFLWVWGQQERGRGLMEMAEHCSLKHLQHRRPFAMGILNVPLGFLLSVVRCWGCFYTVHMIF